MTHVSFSNVHVASVKILTIILALFAAFSEASSFAPHPSTTSRCNLETTLPPTRGPKVRASSRIRTGQANISQQGDFQWNLQAQHQARKYRPCVGIRDVIRGIRRTRRNKLVPKSKSKLYKNIIPRGGGSKNIEQEEENGAVSKSNIRMYGWCLFVVLVWISTGTIFYSKFNNWPLPQSFFYAVDAGMSIGFCTDVVETRIGSRAFTIVFILLGASCIGGALALFIKDIMEGVVDLRNDKFEQLLAEHAAKRYQKKGKLTRRQFRMLVEEWTDQKISDETFKKLCRRFDPSDKGTIRSHKFVEKCHEMDTLLNTEGPLYSKRFMVRKAAQMREFLRESFGTHRIFTVFIIWVSVGIWWGHKRQGWDLITSTHFAISALATGGLTGPEVNAMGILPTEPALFCGFFCLFGIPLFALTLGQFARVLVEGYIAAVEEKAVKQSIYQPLIVTEFEYAKHLCSTDGDIHLSDFLVLQLLRQGKIDIRMVKLIKAQFDALDTDGSGLITFDEAMSRTVIPRFPSTLREVDDN